MTSVSLLARAIRFPASIARSVIRNNDTGVLAFSGPVVGISDALFTGNESAGDLWPLADALKPIPSLLVRGGLSDILSAETADRMQAELPLLERIDLPRIGHAPTLFEPECEAAIDRLLARVDRAG